MNEEECYPAGEVTLFLACLFVVLTVLFVLVVKPDLMLVLFKEMVFDYKSLFARDFSVAVIPFVTPLAFAYTVYFLARKRRFLRPGR